MIEPSQAQQLHLNWIDYTIIAIVAFSAIISFFRGFVREAISMVAWVAGLFVALKYAIILQVYLAPWIDSESVRYFIAFVGLFLVIVVAGLLVNIIVNMLMSKAGLSFVDRFVGIVFGAGRGIAIVAVMLLMLNSLGTVKDSFALSQSRLSVAFKPVVVWLSGFLPEKINAATHWVENDLKIHTEKSQR